MDRDSAISYITGVNWRHSRLGLERITELLHRLGEPQNALRFVHVAGTNGKSSTSAMLAEVLCAAGYTTGLYTSPYINRFNERMQVDGEPIPDDELAGVTAWVKDEADAMGDHPTEFELVTAVALEWYRRRGCHLVVLEVGLGGRLDATNVIGTPELAVITTIALDHTAELGGTLEQIAAEKAGIIKPGGRVVLYPQPPAVLAVFRAACEARGAQLEVVNLDSLVPVSAGLDGQVFDYGGLKNLRIGLLGPYQQRNAATVVTAAKALRRQGRDISDAAIRQGLAATRWPARFELVARRPAMVVDGGHNPQCAEALVQGLNAYFPGRRVLLVTGVMADKDYAATYAGVLPHVAQVFCVTPQNPRALPAAELAAFISARWPGRVEVFEDVQSGVCAALAAAGPEDVVCSFGSFYMAGEIRAFFGRG